MASVRDKSYILFSFDDTTAATKALEKTADLAMARLIPLPTEIGAGCGYSLRIAKEDKDKALDILGSDEYDKVFTLDYEGNKRVIEEYVF